MIESRVEAYERRCHWSLKLSKSILSYYLVIEKDPICTRRLSTNVLKLSYQSKLIWKEKSLLYKEIIWVTWLVISSSVYLKNNIIYITTLFFLFKFISTLILTIGIDIFIYEFLWNHHNIPVLQCYSLVGKFMFFLNG